MVKTYQTFAGAFKTEHRLLHTLQPMISRRLILFLTPSLIFVGLLVCMSMPAVAVPPAGSAEEAAVISAGLTAWRKPDGNGLTCAQCHTPFAYDIAQFNFTRADVRLATTPHLAQPDADVIFDMIEVYRAKYPPAGGLKDFRTFRPMQPGGGVIVGGEDSSADVRDAAFGFQLRNRFRFAQDRIRSLAESRAAAAELIHVRVADIPIGIRFNHWSRSVLREGAALGGEVAKWLPSAGLVAKPAFAAQWLALQDAYIADPSTANMWAIYGAMGTMTTLDAHNFIPNVTHPNWEWIIRGQHFANLIFAHDELLKARGLPSLLAAEDGQRPFRSVRDTINNNSLSPFWQVGDNARVVENRPFSELPVRNKDTIYLGPNHDTENETFTIDQIDNFRLTWFWMGWMRDNSLRFSGEGSTLSGEYFIGSLWTGESDEDASHGMRMHEVFFNIIQQYKLGFLPGSERDDEVQRFDSRKGYYLGYYRWHPRDEGSEIGLTGANQLYRRMLSNHQRMNVLIHNDELRRIGIGHLSSDEKGWLYADIELWREVLHWGDKEWTSADDALLDTFKQTIQGTVRSLPPFITAGGSAFDLMRRVLLVPMSDAAVIHYTTDGTTPSGSVGQIYTGPFNVPSGVTVRAVAIESGLPTSYEVNSTYGPTGRADQLSSGVTPTNELTMDEGPSERGVRFKVEVEGVMTELRYYRTANETGAHTGHLWRSTGELLATVNFPASNDTAGAGWRTVTLPTPLLLSPGQAYVLSVNANTRCAAIPGGFDRSRRVGAIVAFAEGNGVFAVRNNFPSQADQNTDYLRDLTFIATTPRETWRLSKFATPVPSGAAADLADPDGDGDVNLVEYALSGEPKTSDKNPGYTVSLGATGALQLTFLRARADITYTVEGSSDLQTWQSLAVNPGAVGATVPVPDVPPLGATRRFLRLRMSVP